MHVVVKTNVKGDNKGTRREIKRHQSSGGK